MALPDPRPGLVVSHAYLWHPEHLKGLEEGKVRPCVIVLTIERTHEGDIEVTVVPVTHRAPPEGATAVEIPHAVKRALGLDDDRSWIILDEGNEFVWPGFDLRKIPTTGNFHYGFLPPRLFDEVRDKFLAVYRQGRTRLMER